MHRYGDTSEPSQARALGTLPAPHLNARVHSADTCDSLYRRLGRGPSVYPGYWATVLPMDRVIGVDALLTRAVPGHTYEPLKHGVRLPRRPITTLV